MLYFLLLIIPFDFHLTCIAFPAEHFLAEIYCLFMYVVISIRFLKASFTIVILKSLSNNFNIWLISQSVSIDYFLFKLWPTFFLITNVSFSV